MKKYSNTFATGIFIAIEGYALGGIAAWILSFLPYINTFSFMLGSIVAIFFAYWTKESIKKANISNTKKIILSCMVLVITILLSFVLSFYLRYMALQQFEQMIY